MSKATGTNAPGSYMGARETPRPTLTKAADWDLWPHIPQVKLWEAVALSLDLEPVDLQHGPIDGLGPPEFTRRLKIATANLEPAGSLPVVSSRNFGGGATVSLAAFAGWAKSQLWSLPPRFQPRQLPSKPESTEETLGERERSTLLKLVIGMAIGGYGFDPTSGKSDAPKRIADDLAERGMQVSDETVRKYLKMAREKVLPSTSPDQKRIR